MDIPAPFAAVRNVVRPEWIDYNGHMNVGYYHVVFDIAAEPFFEFLGFTQAHRERHSSTTFALEAHQNFLQLLDFDAKRVHYYQEMFHSAEGYLAASIETLSSNMSMATRRTAPMPDELLERLAAIKAAHAALPRPWQIGHVISARPVR